MHFEAHAGLGWTLGTLPPSTDRRLRLWCVAAAVLPDIDAVSYLFGPVAYGRWHHTFGHNVFVGLACAALAAWRHRRLGARRAGAVAALVSVCFASHLVADAKLSAYTVKPFWPASHAEYEFTPNLGLASPVNSALVYASFASVLLLALWKKHTPLELLSPRLDRLVVNAFRRRDLACESCGRTCNNRCDGCSEPVCLHHARVERGFRLRCATCPPVSGPTWTCGSRDRCSPRAGPAPSPTRATFPFAWRPALGRDGALLGSSCGSSKGRCRGSTHGVRVRSSCRGSARAPRSR